jgi:hypothetical protein
VAIVDPDGRKVSRKALPEFQGNPGKGFAYSTRGQLFDGYVGERLVVSRSSQPMLDACRVLATEGVDPSAPVVMRHKGQDHDAPQSTIGKAASLTVTTIRGKTVFAKWRVRAWEHLSRAVRLPSQGLRCMMTATLRASATLALFIPLRLTSFIAQLFNAVQPLSGLVSVMLAAVENRAHPCITESKCHYRGECSLLPSVSPPCLGRPE